MGICVRRVEIKAVGEMTIKMLWVLRLGIAQMTSH